MDYKQINWTKTGSSAHAEEQGTKYRQMYYRSVYLLIQLRSYAVLSNTYEVTNAKRTCKSSV